MSVTNTETVPLKSDHHITWRQVSVGQGGSCKALAYHPFDPDIMICSNDMGGSFRTTDAGSTWTSICSSDGDFYQPRQFEECVFSRKNPDIAYIAAGVRGLHRSCDAGNSWKLQKNSIEHGIVSSAIGIDPDDPETIYVGTGNKWVDTLSYLSDLRRVPGGVFFSTDGGTTFEKRSNGIHPKAVVRKIIIDPFWGSKECRRVFAATSHGLYRSEDSGESWKELTASLPHGRCMDLAISFSKQAESYVLFLVLRTLLEGDRRTGSLKGGIFRSDDQGDSWTEINNNLYLDFTALPYNEISSSIIKNVKEYAFKLEMRRTYEEEDQRHYEQYGRYRETRERMIFVPDDNEEYKNSEEVQDGGLFPFHANVLQNFVKVMPVPDNPEVIYLCVNHAQCSCMPYGMWKSTNGGERWEFITRKMDGWNDPLWQGADIATETKENMNVCPLWEWIYTDFRQQMANLGPVGDFSVRCSACYDETKLAFSTVRAVYLTRDGGESWDDPSTVALGDGTFRGAGNSNVTLTGITMHPTKADSIYLLGNDEPIWLTEDSGETLRNFGEFGNCTALEFSPRDPAVFYASRTRGFNHIGHILRYESSANKSGATYTVLARPFKTACISGIQIWDSEESIFVSGVSYARDFKNYCFGAAGAGVAFSEDGGISFTSVNIGLPDGLNVAALATGGALYAAVRLMQSGDMRSPGGLYRLEKNGMRWRCVTPPEVENVFSVATHPLDPDFLVLSNCVASAQYDAGGVYQSRDAGKTWQLILNAPYCVCAAVHPENPEVIVAVVEACNRMNYAHSEFDKTKNSGVFMTLDGGESWTKENSGLDLLWIKDIKFHPLKHDEVWCASYGTGAYCGKLRT